MALTHGIPRRRADEVIELAGLGSVAKKRAGAFSLLRFPIRIPGRVHSATQILDHVWHTVPGPGYPLRPDLP